MTAQVDVVLPVLDEAGALPWVLSRFPPGYRPIVVDNGSVDDSAAVARAHGAHVVVEPRRGFGAACSAGLSVATAPIVAFMDADASLDPRDLEVVCGPVRDGSADLVLGARVPQPGAWPWHARMANRRLAVRVARLVPGEFTDLGPMRAMRREPLVGLAMADRTYGWPLEMVLKAGRAGWRIEERAVPYHVRIGESKVTGTVRGTFGAYRSMTRLLAEYS